MFLTYESASKQLPIRSVYRRSPSFGESFHWLEAGWENERTVIMMHGIMAHSMAYRKVVEALAVDHRVILPDLPAHGRDQTFRSGKLPPRVDALMDWLRELLDVIDAPEHHVVGHSLGALAAFMAARQPERFSDIARLALVSPGLRIGVPRWTPALLEKLPFRFAKLGAHPLGFRLYEPIQWRKCRMSSSEVDSYLEPLKEPARLEYIMELGVDLTRTPDRLDGTERIHQPTLIMWGDRDHLLPVDTAYELKAAIAGSELAILEGVGHCPMEDAPDEFARYLSQFLERADVSSAFEKAG